MKNKRCIAFCLVCLFLVIFFSRTEAQAAVKKTKTFTIKNLGENCSIRVIKNRDSDGQTFELTNQYGNYWTTNEQTGVYRWPDGAGGTISVSIRQKARYEYEATIVMNAVDVSYNTPYLLIYSGNKDTDYYTPAGFENGVEGETGISGGGWGEIHNLNDWSDDSTCRFYIGAGYLYNSVTVKWELRQRYASYQVRHYARNLDGSWALVENGTFSAIAGSYVTPGVRSYTGFASPPAQTAAVASDGSTVVNYFYERNRYTVSLGSSTGIAWIYGTGSYLYGETVTIYAETEAGYAWKGWSGSYDVAASAYTFVMPPYSLAFFANAEWIEHEPTITAKNLYFTLDQAQNGEITEIAIGSSAYAYDEEEGEIPYGVHEKASMLLTDYQAEDFTKMTKAGSVTETFLVRDRSGNTCSARITVYVVDTVPYRAKERDGRIRFISSKYWKSENGGFGGKSCWMCLPDYRKLLEQLFET